MTTNIASFRNHPEFNNGVGVILGGGLGLIAVKTYLPAHSDSEVISQCGLFGGAIAGSKIGGTNLVKYGAATFGLAKSIKSIKGLFGATLGWVAAKKVASHLKLPGDSWKYFAIVSLASMAGSMIGESNSIPRGLESVADRVQYLKKFKDAWLERKPARLTPISVSQITDINRESWLTDTTDGKWYVGPAKVTLLRNGEDLGCEFEHAESGTSFRMLVRHDDRPADCRMMDYYKCKPLITENDSLSFFHPLLTWNFRKKKPNESNELYAPNDTKDRIEVNLSKFGNIIFCRIFDDALKTSQIINLDSENQPIHEIVATLSNTNPELTEDGQVTFAPVQPLHEWDLKNKKIILIHDGSMLGFRVYEAARNSFSTLYHASYDDRNVRQPDSQRSVNSQIPEDERPLHHSRFDTRVYKHFNRVPRQFNLAEIPSLLNEHLIPIQERIAYIKNFKVTEANTNTKATPAPHSAKLEPIIATSRIDCRCKLSCNWWGVTLINNGGIIKKECKGMKITIAKDFHASLILEGIEFGKYFMKKIDFDSENDNSPGKAEVSDFTNNNLRFAGRTQLWKVPSSQANAMLEMIKEQATTHSFPNFYTAGNSSVLSNPNDDNCFSYLRNTLANFFNIHLKQSIFDFFADYSKRYTSPINKAITNPYTSKPICLTPVVGILNNECCEMFREHRYDWI